MARRGGKRSARPHVPLDIERARGGVRREPGPGGETYTVRRVQATKPYTCPGCCQVIAVGTGHIVAWSEFGGVEERRHWHSSCWQRAQRGAR